QCRVDRDAGEVHRRSVAVQARPAREHVVRPGDDGDPAASEVEQVPGGCETAVPVARSDRGRVVAGFAGGVDEHQGDVTAAQSAALLFGEAGEDGDDAGRAAGEDVLDPAASRCPFPAELGHDHGQAILASHLVGAVDDLDAVQ